MALVEPAAHVATAGATYVATYAAVCDHPPLHLEAYLVQCAHHQAFFSAVLLLHVLSVPAQNFDLVGQLDYGLFLLHQAILQALRGHFVLHLRCLQRLLHVRL